MKSKKSTIGDLFYVTDFVANGSFASLKNNVKYLYEPNYAILIRLTDSTKNWNGDYVYVDKTSYDYLSKSKVFSGDLIISNVGEPGIPFIVPELEKPMTLGPNSILLRPLDNDISTEFIYYLMKSPEGQSKISKIVSNTTIRKFNKTNFRNIELTIPEYKAQLHIANILRKAETLIARRKESIRLLDEFLKSTFLEMFGDPVRNEKGWEVKSGNDYLSKLTVGVVIKPASYYVSEGVIALRSLNIRPNKIQLDNLVYFSKTANENELSKSILREGDVVFVRTGMTGTAAIIPKELDGCNCIDLIVTRPKLSVINPQYLVYFFNSEMGKRIVSAKEVGGIQKHFNIGALRKLEIPVPPIKLQVKFARIVEKTEVLNTYYQESLQEIQHLYGSLSQRAFKGEMNLRHSETNN